MEKNLTQKKGPLRLFLFNRPHGLIIKTMSSIHHSALAHISISIEKFNSDQIVVARCGARVKKARHECCEQCQIGPSKSNQKLVVDSEKRSAEDNALLPIPLLEGAWCDWVWETSSEQEATPSVQQQRPVRSLNLEPTTATQVHQGIFARHAHLLQCRL